MQLALLFLIGFLAGGVVTYRLIVHALQRSRAADQNYVPTARAVIKHLRAHGTVNHSQAGRLLSVRVIDAKRYLGQMEKDGILKAHKHGGRDRFYTLG